MCPHKQQQQQQQTEVAATIDAPEEPAKNPQEAQEKQTKSLGTSTPCSHKKRSVGSVDAQLMRAPSLQASLSRRKSECNRMYSVTETPSASPAPGEAAVGNNSKRNNSNDAAPSLKPLDATERPASACCSYASLETRAPSDQAPTVTRKSSLSYGRTLDLGTMDKHRATLKGAQSMHGQLSAESAVTATVAAAADDRCVTDLERELEALKICIERRAGGVKMSKVTATYLSYFKQWAEYDPFITSPIPSNPWISDSTELWDSERQTKDVHCRRVRRWAFSLKELLNDPAGREQFYKFLEKEFSAENLKFWDAVQELKRVHARDVARRVEAIWTEYLAQDANCPINIDSKSYETSRRNMAKNKNNRYIFDEAAGHVYQLMKNDSYPRYLRSDMYKDYKEASEKKRVAFDVFKPQITTLKHKFNF